MWRKLSLRGRGFLLISERAVKLAGTTYRAMSIRTVGIDIGTGSTVVVADDGDLVLTSTGSISRASSAAFYGRTRMVGEESVPHTASPDTVNSLNLFISQKTVEELNASFHHYHLLVFTRSSLVGLSPVTASAWRALRAAAACSFSTAFPPLPASATLFSAAASLSTLE